MKLFFILLFLLVFGSFAVASVEISEVMYNPSTSMGDDSDLEWIEIYNDGTEMADLTNFTIDGKKFDDISISPKEYVIIAKELIDGSDADKNSFESFYGNNDNVWNNLDGNFTAVDSLAFNFGNTEDTIVFSDGITTITISYIDDEGGDGNGQTLCQFNNIWQECLPTPGQENIVNQEEQSPAPVSALEKEIMLTPYLDQIIHLGNRYTKLFKININNKDPCSKENVTVYYNITNPNLIKSDNFTKEVGCSSSASTGEFIPSETGNYTLCGTIESGNTACMNFSVIDPSIIPCDLNLQINVNNNSNNDFNNNFIYEEGESLKFKPILNNKTFPFVIEYWVEDLFGNVVKNKVNTTNTNQKSWKTNVDEKDKVLFIKSILYPACNDLNTADNFAEEMFIVMEKEVLDISSNGGEENSSITINKITPTEISFGELIKAEVEIYKGSTNKYSVSVWVEKDGKSISEKTKINLMNKNINYKLTLPVQLKPNCDDKIKDGNAKLIVKGLDEMAEEQITISGISKDLCKEVVGTTETSTNPLTETPKLSYKIIGLPNDIVLGDILSLKVELNNDDKEHEFEVWSYLYRGSKCYSCGLGEREDNLVEFDLEENEQKVVEFLLKTNEILEGGEYKIKVKIRKDNQKTTKDLTETIFVKEESALTAPNCPPSDEVEGDKYKVKEEGDRKTEESLSERGGVIVYESSSEKAKNLIPSLLFITFGLLSLVLVFKKA